MKSRTTSSTAARLAVTALFALTAGCGGGDPGAAGDSCTVAANADGTATITCEDGTTATVPRGTAGMDGTDGMDGSTCTLTDNLDGTKTIDCGGTVIVVADGTDGTNGTNGTNGVNSADYVPLEAAGVVGLVTDRSGEALTAGTVYFVPAADVAALPATTVAVGSANDEPLEDTIAASGTTFPQATVGADGRYSLATLPAGDWFVTFVPAAADDGHFPGGSICRTSFNTTELVGTRQDIEVSSATPADATYVGSGVCTTCHGRMGIADTMHRNGIWSPDGHGPLQHTERPDLWQALDGEFTTAGTTVYFYAYDSTRGFDKYRTSETDPGTGVSFTVTVREGTSGYEMVLHNVANPADPDRTIRVDSVYGGGVGKQRYLTKITNAFGTYSSTMPLQFNQAGAEDSTFPRTSRQWRDYHGDWWYNETTDTFRVPAASTSFEKNCISCHAVGVQVSGSDTTTWTADLVSDRTFGDFDYDGDGTADEVNVGCETCHGPGSAHWDSAGQGRHIVSPSLLTPEREAMICGQCHSRPKGMLGTDSPVNAAGSMMIAGTSRNDFLANNATFAASPRLDGATTDYHADADLHSKSHHQQYSDFIRSGMYKNDRELMTCSTCHDPHRRDNPRQLRADPTDNAALCGGSCHGTVASNLAGHIDTQLGASMGALMSDANCQNCHMPKTAQSGSGSPGVTISGTRYWQGDISSHLFAVPSATASRDTAGGGVSMPTPFTNTCGTGCHSSF